jgi:hypothetical protein
MDIEIRRGLAEARTLAQDRWPALLAYVGLGVWLPFVLLASEPIFDLRAILAIMSDPFTYRVGGSIAGPLYLLGIVAVIVCGAMLATWNALLIEMREGYISEIMYGMVAGAAYLVVNCIFYFGIGVILSIPILLLGGFEAAQTWGTPYLVGRHIVSTVTGAWLSARFCLVGPIMGAAGRLEPVSAFIESWQRTASAQGRLFAFYIALNIVVAVATAALLAPHIYFVFNSPQGGIADWVMHFGWLIFWSVYFAATMLIPAGFYRASQPGATAAEVFA